MKKLYRDNTLYQVKTLISDFNENIPQYFTGPACSAIDDLDLNI
jgi:hypothetical protein